MALKRSQSSSTLRRLALICLLVAAWAGTARAAAQETEQSPEQVALEAARTRQAELSEEERSSKTGWGPALAMRIRLLEEWQAASAKPPEVPDEALQEQRRGALEADLERWLAAELPEVSSLTEIDHLAQFEGEASEAKGRQATAQQALAEAQSGIKAARDQLTQLLHREADVRQRKQSLVGEDELTRYAVQSTEIEARVVTASTNQLTAALETWKALEPALQLELAIAERKAELAESFLQQARVRAAELRDEEERLARESAEDVARQALAEQDPVERLRLRMRSGVSTLAADDAAQRTQIEELKARITRERRRLDGLADDYSALRKRLRVRPEGADRLLLRNRKRCKQVLRQVQHVDLPEVFSQAEDTQEDLAELLDLQWELRMTRIENTRLAEFLPEMGAGEEDEYQELFPEVLREEGLFEALTLRREGLEDTDARYSELSNLLEQIEETLAEQQDYIAEQMMWIRSAPGIGVETLTGAWAELKPLYLIFKGDAQSRIANAPAWRWMSCLAMFAGLAVLHRSLRRLRQKHRDREAPGFRPVLWKWVRGLVNAVLPSFAIWTAIGILRLEQVQAPELHPLASLLEWQALLILIRRVSRALLGPGGIAVGKWGVLPGVALQLDRSIRIATLAGQLFYVPVLLFSAEPFSAENLSRILWVLHVALTGVAILLLLRRKGPIVQHWTAPGSFSRLAVKVLGALGLLMLGPVVLMDALGYRIGSAQYALNGMRVFEALFVLMGIYRILDRAGEIAVQHFLRDKEEDGKNQERGALRKATKALTELASTLSILIAMIALQRAWDIGVHAQRMLSSLEILKLSSGSWLTGWDVALGLLWIIGGHITVRNLSRLHDRVLVPIIGSGEVGGRYAILTLVRYAILCLSYLGGLYTFGLDAGTLGWLMTGASVGLGFGLQEIVANFICGLILLFEQPIRVGDIISVGTTGGKIEKITIRATVVTNWERQTIIIPNKTFITQNLINWTRNDQVMRRTLLVRVAYGTDMEKVLTIIDGILSAHPSVLKDPPHRIWVQKFGDVGIELDVWFFASIGDGLTTRSDVHAAILARFETEGIEIPFMARDMFLPE